MHSELDSVPRRSPLWIEVCLATGLALAAIWLLFSDLGAASFHDGDEALYAAASAEMVDSGDFLTPTYWGEPLLNKPPLMYWLMSGCMQWLPGDLEWQARFPSALAAFALLALVYATTRRFAGPWAGGFAVLMLLGNHQFLFEHAARSANLDSALVALMFAAVVFGARGDSRRGAVPLSAICTAAVMMVKLPLVIFIVPFVGLHLWLRDRASAKRWAKWCVASLLLLVVPWHAYAFAVHGQEFWDVYFVYEILGRTGKAAIDPTTTWWLPLYAVWQSFLPWSPLLVLAAGLGVIGWPKAGAGQGALRLLATYGLATLVFFCFLEAKWPWYGLPAYPALAVVGAVFVQRLLSSQWSWAAPTSLAALVLLRLLAIQVHADYGPAARAAHLWPMSSAFYSSGWASPGALEWVLVLVVSGLVVASFLPRIRSRAALLSIAIGSVGIAVTLTAVGRVPREYRAPTSELVARLVEDGVERVATIGFWTTDVYQGRQVPITGVYFIGEFGSNAVDCGSSFECLNDDLGARAAVVINETSLPPRGQRRLIRTLEKLKFPPSVWILNPEPDGEFRELEWR